MPQKKKPSRRKKPAAQKKQTAPQNKQAKQQRTWTLVVRWVVIALIVLALAGSVLLGALSSRYKVSSTAPANAAITLAGISVAPVREGTTYAGIAYTATRAQSLLYAASTYKIPTVEADCAGLCTADGQVLFSKNTEEKVVMASATKIMTAIVALESASLDTMMKVTFGAEHTEGSLAWLQEGMTLSLSNLLYCLMVASGNDAAVCIAQNISGVESRFVSLMNQKAQVLGMTSTVYKDVMGLSEENYSTVDDYLKLTVYAMRNEAFREVVATQYKEIYVDGITLTLDNANILGEFLENPQVTGVITGSLDGLEYCLIGSALYNGIELYTVIFRSYDNVGRFTSSSTLLEWGFKHYRTIELINPTQLVGRAALTSWTNKTVPVSTPAAIQIEVFDVNGPLYQEVVLDDIKGAVVEGQTCGTVIWIQNDVQVASSELVATQTVAAPGFFESVRIGWIRFWGFFTGADSHASHAVYLKSQVPVPAASE